MSKIDTMEKKEEETWGTLEELLLACAVNRHGTKNWDSVAMEIQSRSSLLHILLTPQCCKQKYNELNRRFMPNQESEDDNKDHHDVPWLDELKKLRVAELKREVQRYDVSILAKQLKVKQLEEEHERSLREEENKEKKPDLKEDPSVKEETEKYEESKKSLSENVAGKHVSGEESDRENQSFNESNSTEPKEENRETENGEKISEPVEPGPVEPIPVSGNSKPICEGSYNGSTSTSNQRVRKLTGARNSPELWESVGESKREGGGGGGGGGEETTKENSDVQSSVSLSKRNRELEPETEEISPAMMKRISVEPPPLIDFLAKIRSNKFASIFERRLESQETAKYRSLIRHHIDLESVCTRLEQGRYRCCIPKFFRDLLLVFTNAIVFFSKNSPESIAALHLRQLVMKEMETRTWKLALSPKEKTPPSIAMPPAPKPNPKPRQPNDSLLVKTKSSGSTFACRSKRSSISAKASSSSSAPMGRKGEQRAATMITEKLVDNSSADAIEEQAITMKRTRETSRSVSKRSRTCNKSQTLRPSLNPGSERNPEPKMEKMNNVVGIAKKRSAASFSDRMKPNSSSNGTLLETLKSPVNSSNNNSKGGGSERGREMEKKKSGGRIDGRKDQVSRQSSGRKQTIVESSPGKRSVGRPPKRTVEPPLPPPPAPVAKRTRETVETERKASRQSRKRARR